MLGAADHRNVGPWSGGRDEPADCLAALHGRSEVERAPVDVSANRRRRLVSRLGTAADERKIAAGGQEPSSRAGDAPGAGDRGHLEVVTENEAGEAETPPEQAADDLGGERRRRSEERRVGKECRTRWAQYHEKNKIR